MIWLFDLFFYTRGVIKWASFPTVHFTMPSRPIPAYTDNHAKNHKVATFPAARFTMAQCLAIVRNFVQGGALMEAPKGSHKAGCQRIRPVSRSLKSAPRWDANTSGLSRRVARRHHTGTPAHPDCLNESQNGTTLGSQRIRPVSTNLKTAPSWEPHPAGLNESQIGTKLGRQNKCNICGIRYQCGKHADLMA
jgi:hypothetical protein